MTFYQEDIAQMVERNKTSYSSTMAVINSKILARIIWKLLTQAIEKKEINQHKILKLVY
jgi:hypothetical protein